MGSSTLWGDISGFSGPHLGVEVGDAGAQAAGQGAVGHPLVHRLHAVPEHYRLLRVLGHPLRTHTSTSTPYSAIRSTTSRLSEMADGHPHLQGVGNGADDDAEEYEAEDDAEHGDKGLRDRGRQHVAVAHRADCAQNLGGDLRGIFRV